ncbi:pknH-like extracellular domain protein [Mycobacterium kansasii]|uniref:PknH-like extracellular domain protein n=1 Tax=Mycobacterium kansasii TaxID=1768 RepID=A0A1V3WZY4_MYCKA|nr:pknH-like extracellular domain protein [Mycobacterium kansasii]
MVNYAVLGRGSVGNIVGAPMGWESVFTEPFQAYAVDLPVCNNWADIGLPEVYNDPDLASFNGAITQTSATDQTHYVKQAVGVFASNDAAGRAFHRVVDRTVGCSGKPPRCTWTTGPRRCGRSTAGRLPQPTRRGPSRKPAPTGGASIKPGCAKMCCCKPRSASPATAGPRSTCWPGNAEHPGPVTTRECGYSSDPGTENVREYVGALWKMRWWRLSFSIAAQAPEES